MYREFDFIKIRKMHPNNFFKYADDPKKLSDVVLSKDGMSSLVKVRPAIIIRTFKPKFDAKGKDKNKYLIIPLTTKSTISKWAGVNERMRIEFKHPMLKNGKSYMMLDSMMMISSNQILEYYSMKGQIVNFTRSERRWIKKSLNEKLERIIPGMHLDKNIGHKHKGN